VAARFPPYTPLLEEQLVLSLATPHVAAAIDADRRRINRPVPTDHQLRETRERRQFVLTLLRRGA
jgi:hypothetical protein